ncbi:MAG: hypothetical protein A2X59_00340 [Nitrospirae bacterium GWC2_42_7]|nr:MAG: hypothetical protein A2X59_00340 [Nitrospirae bacterium GWC2_42_7]
MMLTEDKISHLSHVLLKNLIERNVLELVEDEGMIRREIKRTIVAELKIGEDIDQSVRRKLQSFSKKLTEGSPEWEILYKKFFREEETKRGRASG